MSDSCHSGASTPVPADRSHGERGGSSTSSSLSDSSGGGGGGGSSGSSSSVDSGCKAGVGDGVGGVGSGSGAGPTCGSGSASGGIRAAALVDAANDSWASLDAGIVQRVLRAAGAGASPRALRLVCRHWRAAVDHSVTALSPLVFRSRLVVALFPRLQVLDLTRCGNVRNRDLFLLAESADALLLRCLTVCDSVRTPWVTNKGLVSIGRLTSLRSLALLNCNNITNQGLAQLKDLVLLTSLSLRGSKRVTNTGLEVLQSYPELESLDLYGCARIGDPGIALLARAPLLRALTLGLTHARDGGFERLGDLTQLTELQCLSEEVSGEGVMHLARLTGLVKLTLSNCGSAPGDALASLLPRLPRLLHLDLSDNRGFTDAHLAGCSRCLTGLRSLNLRGTAVTEAGLSQLTDLKRLSRLVALGSEQPQEEQQQRQQQWQSPGRRSSSGGSVVGAKVAMDGPTAADAEAAQEAAAAAATGRDEAAPAAAAPVEVASS